MGLHVVALAKLPLLSNTNHTVNAILMSLLCPFVVKLSFSFRHVRGAYMDVLHASRLFFFQLGQIAFDTDPALANGSRWHRAVRLVCRRLTNVRRSPITQSDEDSFHTLTMLSL